MVFLKLGLQKLASSPVPRAFPTHIVNKKAIKYFELPQLVYKSKKEQTNLSGLKFNSSLINNKISLTYCPSFPVTYTLTQRKSVLQTIDIHRRVHSLITLKPNSRNLLIKSKQCPSQCRFLHQRAPNNFGRNNEGPFKVKFYRIPSPTFMFVSFFVFFFLLSLIPFIIKFFFPLIIFGIVWFQIKKWRRYNDSSKLIRMLERSRINFDYPSLYYLEIKSMEDFIKRTSKVFESTITFPKQNIYTTTRTLFSKLEKQWRDSFSGNKNNSTELLDFSKRRILDAIFNDEQNIRTDLLGDDPTLWVSNNYNLKLDTSLSSIRANYIDNDTVVFLTYPLFLTSDSGKDDHIANVSIIYIDNKMQRTNGKLERLASLSSNADCNIALVVTKVRKYFWEWEPKTYVFNTDN